MRLLLDENLSTRICPWLIGAGHDAVHVADLGLTGVDDQVILDRARAEEWVVVSCDHDFVQLLFASGDVSPSLILTRDVEVLRSDELAQLLVAAISPELEKFMTDGAVATLTRDRVRVRPLPLR